jgi:hypothetical protein
MKVKLLTPEQAQSLFGHLFKDYHEFSPVIDGNGNYIISLESATENENPDFDWVKDLPEIDFVMNTKSLEDYIAESQN